MLLLIKNSINSDYSLYLIVEFDYQIDVRLQFII